MRRLTRRGELDGGAYAESDNASILERLCQWEEAMEAGRTVILPLNNGDTVWTVGFDGCAKIHPFSRKVLHQEVSGQPGGFKIRLHCRDCVFAAEDEGKTWWRTQDAAEKHMRARPNWYVRWKTRGPQHEKYGRFAAEKD